MANRTKFTAKKRKLFLQRLLKTGNVSLAAHSAGISRRRAYEVRDEDPEFEAEWDDKVNEYTDSLISEAERRGRKGIVKPLLWRGEVVLKVREYSDNLLMFSIKGRRKEYATERRELTGENGGAILVDRIRRARERAGNSNKTDL